MCVYVCVRVYVIKREQNCPKMGMAVNLFRFLSYICILLVGSIFASYRGRYTNQKTYQRGKYHTKTLFSTPKPKEYTQTQNSYKHTDDNKEDKKHIASMNKGIGRYFKITTTTTTLYPNHDNNNNKKAIQIRNDT